MTGPEYGQRGFDYLSRVAAVPPEQDGPVFIVYLLKRGPAVDHPDQSLHDARKTDAGYAPVEALREIGAQVVFVADVQRQLIGASPAWDRVSVVKYATRASFLEMQRRADFEERPARDDAGLEHAIVLACTPLVLPEFPAVEPGDDPFVMLHVLKFAEGGVARMAEYGATAGAEGLALGVRPEVFLAVEGTVGGDGRHWDQVRFNRFPSHDVFEQLRAKAAHRAGQPVRESALDESYTLMLKPSLDDLAASTRN